MLRFLLEFSVLFNFLLVNIYVVYNFRYRPSVMSSVIQFSKIDFFFVWKISLPKLNRKCSLTILLLLYFLLRKEVIHPHVPVGIPCYDLTPVIGPTFDGSLLAVMPPASGITDSHGLTGGVYKARERIHRSMLICDY